MLTRYQDPNYKPHRWIPVLDADSIGDKTLADVKRDLEANGVPRYIQHNTSKRRKHRGQYTLYRYGGWSAT